MRLRPELMQLEMGISTRRYLPASGTAGLERSRVSGKRRVPWPPPMMIERTFPIVTAGNFAGAIPQLLKPLVRLANLPIAGVHLTCRWAEAQDALGHIQVTNRGVGAEFT